MRFLRTSAPWAGAALLSLMAVLLLQLVTSTSAVDTTRHSFHYRSYAQMAAFLRELNDTYPDVLHVSVAQDTYNLPYPKELTCIEDDDTQQEGPCKHFLVHLTNHSTLAAHADRPEVFFSGALHGDERIGPASTIELIALMARATSRYSASSQDKTATNGSGNGDGDDNGGDAPMPPATRRWLRELINSRSVFLMPMTNAYGYSHNKRTELNVDPNRDYNYMRAANHCMQTMTSRVINEIWRDHVFQLAITFHGGTRAVTYEWGSPNHYLTTTTPPRSQKSPDHTAQAQLAGVLATYAGAFDDGQLYPTGTMNDVVYGVTGGMEDWGYAASWENQFVGEARTNGGPAAKPFEPCNPTTFGGYDAARTKYNNVTHRAFNILVETSKNKQPSESTLGDREDVYAAELDFWGVSERAAAATDAYTPFGVGHVPQNVRMALMLIEMVQPYLRWVHSRVVATTTNNTSLDADERETEKKKDDEEDSDPWSHMRRARARARALNDEIEEPVLAPEDTFISASLFVEDEATLLKMGCSADQFADTTDAATVNATTSVQVVTCASTSCHFKQEEGKQLKLHVAWEVLGAITVDRTHVELSTDKTFATDAIISRSVVMKGKTRRYYDLSTVDAAAHNDADDDNADTFGTSLFISCVDGAPASDSTQTYYLRASAIVDHDWKTQATGDDGPSPIIPPQSHIVNARTNPDWDMESNGHRVKSSLHWYSPIIELTVEPSSLEPPLAVSTRPSLAKEANDPTRVPTRPDTPSITEVAVPSEAPVLTSETPISSFETSEPTTQAPAFTTEAPVPVTETPVPTTEAPEPTTEAPELTTEAPEPSTETPEVTTETRESTTETPAPTTESLAPTSDPSTPSSSDGAVVSGRQKTQIDVKPTGISLVNYGYLVLSVGGIIITLTVTYLYKRVFRLRARSYMTINEQAQRTPGGLQVSSTEDDEDDDRRSPI